MAKVTRRFFVKVIEAKVVSVETEKVETVTLTNVTGLDGKKLDKWVSAKVDGVLLKYSIVSEYQEIRAMPDEFFYDHSEFLSNER